MLVEVELILHVMKAYEINWMKKFNYNADIINYEKRY